MDKDTAYKILRVSKEATEDDVTQAYFKLVRRYPLETAPIRFREIQEAYTVLKSSSQYWLRKLDENIVDFGFMKKYQSKDIQSETKNNEKVNQVIERNKIEAFKDIWLAFYRHIE